MKKSFTLATAALLAAGALTSAQAQVIVDGQLTAAELTAGNYVLLGKYTSKRGFGPWGLMSLYAANNGTKAYFFLASTLEPNAGGGGNSLQMYMNLPGGPVGLTAGTFLPSPANSSMTTFEQITRVKLEFAPNVALALRNVATATGPQQYALEAMASTSAGAATATTLTTTAASVVGNGTALTVSPLLATGPFAGFAGARVAYRQASGDISTNPGNVPTNPTNDPAPTAAAYGGVGSFGWELELDRAATGLTATNLGSVLLLAMQNNSNGGFISSDYIPERTAALPATGGFAGTDNLGGASNGTPNDVDFALVPGRQFAGIRLTAAGVLGSRAAEAAAAMGMNVYPNPATGVATVAYRVAGQSAQVSVVLTDLMGRTVRTIESGLQTPGDKTANLDATNVAAGTYLVKVNVGGTVATSKVVLL